MFIEIKDSGAGIVFSEIPQYPKVRESIFPLMRPRNFSRNTNSQARNIDFGLWDDLKATRENLQTFLVVLKKYTRIADGKAWQIFLVRTGKEELSHL
jgi:hypothetical protein